MKDLANFATDVALHPSGLRTLILCPWRAALEYLEPPGEDHGVAGDTGSATHAAVAEFHKGMDLAACLKAMRDRVREYPRADLQDAASMFLNYASDPRNKSAKLLLIEEQVSFRIAADPEDHTQAPIEIEGTVDQVRDVDGVLRVCDLKTSKKDPTHILAVSAFQVAAYCIGASIKLGKKVQPGPLILPRKYGKDIATSPVFWHYPWTFDDIEQILSPVRRAVANIRAGKIHHLPSDDCMWCGQRSPDLCLPKLQRTIKLRDAS